MDSRIERILITEKEINQAIISAAAWIDKIYDDKELVIITILKGSIPFIGALLPKIKVDFVTDYMTLSSFKGGVKALTTPECISTFTVDISNKHILLVEDIIDSGRTIKEIITLLLKNNVASIKILSLLDKPAGRTVDLKADYVCFEITNQFIVGFGLDYKEKFRNLPYIGILKKEVYES